jgi:hypothetical protein
MASELVTRQQCPQGLPLSGEWQTDAARVGRYRPLIGAKLKETADIGFHALAPNVAPN